MLQCQFNIDPAKLLAVLEEVETKIRKDGVSQQEKSRLYQQLGSLHELMGDHNQRNFAWEQARKLASENQTVGNGF